MFGEITSRNVYPIQFYKQTIGLMSDLLDVEKILKVGKSPVLTYKKCICFNLISLLKQ